MLIVNLVALLVIVQIPVLALAGTPVSATSTLATIVAFVFGALLRWIDGSFFCVTRVVAFKFHWWFSWWTVTCAFTAPLTLLFAALLRWTEKPSSIVTTALALQGLLFFGAFRARAAGKPSAFFLPRFGCVFF